ncbi:SLC13 family permease [Cytophagales bacterium LB-30]|uniref:SLC13 family permease n=1 Tax=Shiella aurantiaca TaxID=3058365 RepID=A0ABT8F7Z2_9BACT|nr:SLC13 family permease [Shiella aurantiaca]MDN4166597.1 SLC13 family permease [Shiella aurantiaca]
MEHLPIFLLIAGLIIALLLDKWESAWVFTAFSLVLVLVGAMSLGDYLKGFANESILTIFLLIVVTSVLQQQFPIHKWVDGLMNKPGQSQSLFFIKVNGFVALISSFVNNTPVVAFFTPYLYKWGEKNGVAPSKLLMPLSFAAIMGGMITLVGTSTNLVLNGLIEQNGGQVLAFFDFLVPGLLITVLGILAMLIFSNQLLPANTLPKTEVLANTREYLAELQVMPGSILIGKTVAEAELRNLQGVFLVEIIRKEQTITPVRPEEKLEQEDILFFAGDTHEIVNLTQKNWGLHFPKQKYLEEDNHIHLVEAVVPANSRLIGRPLRETGFRQKYNAAILAIHRNGERVKGKLGQHIIHAGDMLFLSVGDNFNLQRSDYNDLYIFSEISTLGREERKNQKGRFLLSTALAIGMALVLQTNLLMALLILLIGWALAGFVQLDQLKNEFDPSLLLVLVGALGVGTALLQSGAAAELAQGIGAAIQHLSPWWALLLLYGLTVLLTSFITNVAAVSIAFPITNQLIQLNGWESEPFYLAIAFAASCAFMTPFGYQTNLMIAGPGKYRFVDFLRLGFPITLIYSFLVFFYLSLRYF